MVSMEFYSKAALERAMKVQEVILQTLARKITLWQAAEIIGISDRHMRRWRERYEEFGYDGLFDRRRGKPSPRRVPVAMVEKVFALYRETYFDLNVQHFHEKLKPDHGIELSYTWVKQALQGAGLVGRGRKRGVHRKRRERRPLPGMLLHIDGSRHQWFQDERWYDLIVILDDASSEIYYAQLVEEESTVTVMAGLRQVIERKGVFCALYSDRGSHFWLTPKVGGKVDPHRLTQGGNVFLAGRRRDLDLVFCLQFERAVNRDNTVSFQNLSLQIEAVRWRATLAGCQVMVHQHLDGTLSLTHGTHLLGRYTAEGAAQGAKKMPARRAVEKPRGGKVINPTFPPRLEIPQTARDSHFPTAPTAAG